LDDSVVTSEVFQSSMPGGRKIRPRVTPGARSHCAPTVKMRELSEPKARIVSRNCWGSSVDVFSAPETVLLL
jgi:hypothetical protein